MPVAKDYKPINIAVNERRKYSIQLRSAGLSYREIAKEMLQRYGTDMLPTTYDERYAHRDVKFELDRLRLETMESASDYRMLELERLDQMQTAIFGMAISGDLKAVDRMLKIMHHRALLMGLYAPQQTKVDVNDWHTEIIDLIKSGRITRKQAEEELGEELVNQLLESGSGDIVEGSFTQTEVAPEENVL